MKTVKPMTYTQAYRKLRKAGFTLLFTVIENDVYRFDDCNYINNHEVKYSPKYDRYFFERLIRKNGYNRFEREYLSKDAIIEIDIMAHNSRAPFARSATLLCTRNESDISPFANRILGLGAFL